MVRTLSLHPSQELNPEHSCCETTETAPPHSDLWGHVTPKQQFPLLFRTDISVITHTALTEVLSGEQLMFPADSVCYVFILTLDNDSCVLECVYIVLFLSLYKMLTCVSVKEALQSNHCEGKWWLGWILCMRSEGLQLNIFVFVFCAFVSVHVTMLLLLPASHMVFYTHAHAHRHKSVWVPYVDGQLWVFLPHLNCLQWWERCFFSYLLGTKLSGPIPPVDQGPMVMQQNPISAFLIGLKDEWIEVRLGLC